MSMNFGEGKSDFEEGLTALRLPPLQASYSYLILHLDKWPQSFPSLCPQMTPVIKFFTGLTSRLSVLLTNLQHQSLSSLAATSGSGGTHRCDA